MTTTSMWFVSALDARTHCASHSQPQSGSLTTRAVRTHRHRWRGPNCLLLVPLHQSRPRGLSRVQFGRQGGSSEVPHLVRV
eukprot:1122173-Prymnesium_polylepis.1